MLTQPVSEKLTFFELLAALVQKKRFYATIASALRKVPRPGFGTAAVGIMGGQYVYYYDPDAIEVESYWLGVLTVDHELLHIILDHIPRYHEYVANLLTKEDKELANKVFMLAADCADNCILRKDPHWPRVEKEWDWVTPEKIEEKLREHIPNARIKPDQSLEYYLDTLIEYEKQKPNSVSGMGGGSDHKMWSLELSDDPAQTPQSPEEIRSLASQLRAQGKAIIGRVVKDYEKSHGTVPGEIKEWLDKYLAAPVLPWWDYLSDSVIARRPSNPERTVERMNRALTVLSQQDSRVVASIGRKLKPNYNIFVYLDSSGSMSSEDLAILMSTFEKILATDEDIRVRVMIGDTETHFDQLYGVGDELPREVPGRGGTDFDAYFRYMNRYCEDSELAPDIVIVGTDGACTPPLPESRLPEDIPVLWLLTTPLDAYWSRSLRESGYGEFLYIDPSQRTLWNP